MVSFGNGQAGVVTLNDPVIRLAANPILTAHDVDAVCRDPAMQVVTVHNAGVAIYDGETVMLFRSHLRSGASVIGLARSVDGLTDWHIEPKPFLAPATADDRFGPQVDVSGQIVTEAGGVEDPRINPIDGMFAITYTAYDAHVKDRARVCLALTSDFKSVTRVGPVSDHDMRNVVIFPERIAGRYVGLFRINDDLPGDTGGLFTEIRIGHADDLTAGIWDIESQPVMRTGGGPSAFADKIGPGAPPIRTERGWLNLFHGVRSTMDGNPYVLGIALHALDDPHNVKMSSIPVLFPTRADCRVAETDYVHVPGVVFSTGMIRRADGSLLIYYGGNDTVMNVAITHEDILVELCEL